MTKVINQLEKELTKIEGEIEHVREILVQQEDKIKTEGLEHSSRL
jgi:TolA-binding protein